MRLAIKNTLLRRLTETPVGISARLMTLRIPLVRSCFATLSAYSPTLPLENKDKDCFYQSLDEELCRKSDKSLLLGDFNTRVGKNNFIWSGVLGTHSIGQANANCMTLLTLCAKNNLTIANTILQQKAKYKTSQTHPCSKHWHLIDYVIVRCSDDRCCHHPCHERCRMLDRPPYDCDKGPHESAPLLVDVRVKQETIAIAWGNMYTRKEFSRSLGEKLGETELSLSSVNTIDQKWTSTCSALFEAAAPYHWL